MALIHLVIIVLSIKVCYNNQYKDTIRKVGDMYAVKEIDRSIEDQKNRGREI